MTVPMLVAAMLVAAPADAGASAADELFDSRTLHDVRVYIHSADLRLLRERYFEDTYYPADFEWRGIRMRNVGVRVRGLATRSAVKPGLRIDSTASSGSRPSSAWPRSCSTQRFASCFRGEPAGGRRLARAVGLVRRSRTLVTHVAIEMFLAEFDGFSGDPAWRTSTCSDPSPATCIA